MANGVLLAVVGPAGSGKSAVLDGARRYYVDDRRVLFPRRTLSNMDGSPVNHRSAELFCMVTPAQFQRLRRDEAFSLAWDAGSVSYALPASVRRELTMGRIAVVELAYGVLDEARRCFPHLHVVEVTASPSVLARRTSARPEDESSLPIPTGLTVTTIINDGLPEAAVARLVTVIEEELEHRLPKRAASAPRRAARGLRTGPLGIPRPFA